MKNNKNSDENQLYQKPKLEFKDIAAITIAMFEVLVPIFAIAFTIFGFIILFITKVWLN
ncbi:hypothetical protein HBE96_09275 [Clostridium sp. P21]|uniref:Uncharacterized protein n=1 Tax=Clostridium muellerianum TaxID=2716538 RepID=A0A7Y0EGB1_9CLOT|nr:hypothetical protein [Clostridium muellerianum]NMM62888.1 hypothetical protein [Clostridium muellerianum]